MKLYAFSTPEIPKHNGYLKIGETNGDIQKRLDKECHELNVELKLEWDDVVSTECRGIDKMVHRYLVDQGFHIQVFDRTGRDTEWIKCDVADVEKAFRVIKTQIDNKELQREEVGKQFYLEIRNWFYWTAKTGDDPYSVAEPEYTLRLIVRLLLCFFLQEKGLVPKELFDEDWVNAYLKENEGYRYYNAILRNLFFHCLNTPIKERKTFESVSLFKNPNKVKEQFQKVPFLNGGLFNEISGDDFALDNYHFFADRHFEHIYELGGSYEVEGIVRLLSKYKYKLSLDDLIDHSDYANVIDPEFIGKVFESLLACIDADTKENRRKTTGSFYTPREIVDYMVNESLDSYLQNNSGKDLMDCKILDPACGSGAFPCGIMNEIIRRLDPDKQLAQNERYHKKLEILKKVIYGVDIQPIAVQITVLRLFLSLIQEIVPDKKKDNYGIEPLPNLETKFICANTLIGLAKEKQGLLVSPSVKIAVEMLKNNRDQYVTASTIQDKQKIQEYDEKLRSSFSQLLETEAVFSHDTTERLLKWNPYNQTASADFFDPQWMFGVESFDIVIGNPPYVFTKGSGFSKEFKDYVAKNYFSLFDDNCKKTKAAQSGKINLFVLFIFKGLWISKSNGIVSYIVPNNLLRTTTYDLIRKYILENSTVNELVDLGNGIFDNVTASTIIFRLQNTKKADNICRVITDIESLEKRKFAVTNIKQSQFLNNISYTFNLYADHNINKLLNKICSNKKTLGDISLDIIEGIVAHKHLIFSELSDNSFPLIEGKTIKRYGLNPITKYIFWDKKAIHRTRPDYVWNSSKKIIIQRISGGSNPLTATLDTNKYKTFASVNNLLLNPIFDNCYEYVLALLNSKILNWYYANKFSNNSTLTVNISKTFLSHLPVPVIPFANQQPIITLVNQILLSKKENPEADTLEFETEIDRLVYDLYDLTSEEIKIIETAE